MNAVAGIPLRTAADAAELATTLADDVLAALAGAIAAQGSATLVVSGGSTPKPLFERLAKDRALDWSAVTILLADERVVPPHHPDSNEGMLSRTLLDGSPSAARFVSLYEDGLAEGEPSALRAVAARVEPLDAPFDVVLLGMGDDGHTASLFPDSPQLEAAMAPDAPMPVSLQHPASQPLVRLSLTAARLWRSHRLWLHLTGDGKRATFEAAMRDGRLPIARLLDAEPASTAERAVYWAP